MWRSPITFGLGLSLTLAITPLTGHAQLGGLVKKAKEKAEAATGAPAASTDQPARLPGPEITPMVVDHFLVGLKAEKVARDRAAATEGKRKEAEEQRKRTEAEARLDPQSRHYICVNDKVQADPRYADMQKLSKEADAAAKQGDNTKMMQLAVQISELSAGMQQQADSICTSQQPKTGAAPPPTAEQQAIQDAPAVSPEQDGAKAAAMTPMDYGQIKELIYTYVNYGKRAGLTESEKQAVEAKIKELREALKAIGMN
jgi:hypothetical protein